MGTVDLAPPVVQRHDQPPRRGVGRAWGCHRDDRRPARRALALESSSGPAPPRSSSWHAARSLQSASRHRRAGRGRPPWWPRQRDAGRGHSAPLLSLDHHELDGHLLERLAQVGGIGPGRLQLEVLVGGRAGSWRGPAAHPRWPRWGCMLVERSTCQASAARPWLVAHKLQNNSYFSNGLKNRLARRPARSVPRS